MVGEEWRSYEWMMKHGGVATEYTYGQYLAQVHCDKLSCLVSNGWGFFFLNKSQRPDHSNSSLFFATKNLLFK